MLASIGIMIATKQFYAMIGNPTKEKEPPKVIEAIPEAIQNPKPEVAMIGFACLEIMIFWAVMPKKISWLKKLPAQLVVVAVGILLGYYFSMEPKSKAFVNVPNDIRQGLAFPNFTEAFASDHLYHPLQFILMFS